MIKECVLFYPVGSLDDIMKVRSALELQALRVRVVGPSEAGQKVGYLAGLPDSAPSPVREPAPTPDTGVVVFCGLENDRLDEALAALRRSGVNRPFLKAMLTQANRQWSFAHLCRELMSEREAIRQARQNAQKGKK